MNKKVSRREFLKGITATSLTIAATGLLGACSASKETTSTATQEPTATPATPVSWRAAPESITTFDQEESADVIIVGLGHAGVSAARAAAEAGASVIAIEKLPEETFSYLGNDFGHLNSNWLKEHQIPEVDPTEVLQDWEMRSLYRCNPGLIMQYLQHSGEAFDWMIDIASEEQRNNIRVSNHPYPTNYDFNGTCGGQKFYQGTAQFSGRYFEGIFSMDECQKNVLKYTQGLGVTTHFGMPAVQLIKENDAIVGIVAKDSATGATTKFTATKGVILAAGDFGGNAEMVNELCPELVDSAAMTGSAAMIPMGRDGSGIQMAVWAGGLLEPRPLAAMGGIEFKPAGLGSAGVLWLNSDYERFTTEAIGDGVYSVQTVRTKGPITSVFDGNIMDYLQYFPASHGAMFLNHESLVHDDGVTFKAAIDEAKENGSVELSNDILGSGTLYCADTLEELTDKLGLSEEQKVSFLASSARYNELCAKGKDEDFGKEERYLFPVDTAPFFAIASTPSNGFALVTVGGMMTSKDQQVLDSTLTPIKGLYATGNCSGQRFGYQYFTPIPGVSIGLAVTLGRLAGQHVATL